MRRGAVKLPMLPKQIEFVSSDAKLAAARGGIGSGKTIAAIVWMWSQMRKYPKAGHYVVGADFEQLRLGYFQSFADFLRDMLHWREGVEFRVITTPRPELRFLKTGAVLKSLSAELGERIRSIEIQSVHMEEPQTWKGGNGLGVYRTIVGRMRHTVTTAKLYPDMKPQGRLTFNPCAIGEWLYDLVEKTWKDEGYPSWRFSLRDNTLLKDPEEYIKLQEGNLPRDLWTVEIDGNYRTKGGGVYRNFDAAVHTVDPIGLPPIALNESAPLFWTLDFNVHFQCSLVGQIYVQRPKQVFDGQLIPRKVYDQSAWQSSIPYVLDEITLSGSNGAEDVVEEFLRRYGKLAKKNGLYLYGDPAGGAKTQTMTSAGAINTAWEAIVQGLRKYGITRQNGLLTFRVPNAHPAVQDRIYRVNEQFRAQSSYDEDGNPQQGGFGMLIDANACPELIADLRSMQYKPGTNEVDKPTSADGLTEFSKRSHTSDALGYFCWVERKLAVRHPIRWQMVR